MSEKIRFTNNNSNTDVNALLEEFANEYDVVHCVVIETHVFIYKLLGRRSYKKILAENDNDLDIEDKICKECLLYPIGFDFDDCSAGVPSKLCNEILVNSFLDDIKSTIKLLHHYKEEMFNLEDQMVCIISEAFPIYTLEEIESWHNLKFCKMFSRAEWKFNNLKNSKLSDAIELIEEAINQEDENSDITENNNYQEEFAQQQTTSKNEVKMTPEQYAELQKMKKLFPDIDWDKDEILNKGADNAIKDAQSMSTLAPALRPGWGR